MFSRSAVQIKTELKHNTLSLLVSCAVIMGVTCFLFGTQNLDLKTQGLVIERFLPLIGVFGVATLFYAEHRSPIKDLLLMKSTSIVWLYFMRILIRSLVYGLCSLLYIYIIVSGGFEQKLALITLHSLSIGLLIGALGLFAYSLTNNISLALLVSIGVVLIQWFSSKEKAPPLLLLTLPDLSVNRVLLLLASFSVLVILSMVIWKRKLIA